MLVRVVSQKAQCERDVWTILFAGVVCLDGVYLRERTVLGIYQWKMWHHGSHNMPGCRGGHRMFQKHWYGKDPSEVKIAAGDIQPWAQEHCQPATVDGGCIGGVSKHQKTRPSLGLPQKGWTTRSLRSVAPSPSANVLFWQEVSHTSGTRLYQFGRAETLVWGAEWSRTEQTKTD